MLLVFVKYGKPLQEDTKELIKNKLKKVYQE